jgi:hypothetical protein
MALPEFKIRRNLQWQVLNQPIVKTEYYELDLATTNVVEVGSTKGIIEILDIAAGGEPDRAFGSSIQFYINNPKLLLTEANRDNIYIQYSVYYKPGGIDNTIPYVISNGATPTGLGFEVYNANPAIAGPNNWVGKFYFYFELYNK